MSLTIAAIKSNFDTYLGDSSTDRVSDAERFQYFTEACAWLQEGLGNDHQNTSYTLPYFDSVHYYKVTTTLPDVMNGVDLRRGEDDQVHSFSLLSSRQVAERIGVNNTEPVFSIERRDKQTYLAINCQSKYGFSQASALESLTADEGEWEADTTNSDATALEVDSVEFKQGSGSLKFNADVSQSGNNRSTILNEDYGPQDFSLLKDVASWVFWVYIPVVTNFSSITFYWGSSSTAYWSATATTEMNGGSFVVGWNRIKIDWLNATQTSTPDESAISYLRFDFNYTAGYTDANAFRLDDLKLIRPENLTFIYTSNYVGTNSSGTSLSAFTATTDIPFFSSQYDQYKYAVAHKAASLAFFNLRLRDEALAEEKAANEGLGRVSKLIPTSKLTETKAFKPLGINFTRRTIGRNRSRR
jgi:hypothetical protein